jgi:hypothetical protein
MAKYNFKFHIQVEHDMQLNAAAARLGLSKSEIVGNALALATAEPAQMFSALLAGNTAKINDHKGASYTLDKTVYDEAQLTASRIYMAKDHFLRLALDYYLNHIVKAD